MPLTQTHKIAAAVIIVFGCGSYVAFDALRPPAYHRGQSRKSIAANVDGSDRKPTIKQNTRSKGGSRSQSKPSKSVNDFLAMRDEASRKFSGDRLFAEQRRITTLAITTLRGTDLLEFYRNLFGQGGGGIDFNWALSTGMGHVFEIGNEAEVIKWIADSDDPSLQSKLCYYAGESYYGSEFDAFLKTLSNPKSQSKFLAGHCAQLGINNLPDAINTFISLKPASVDFSDLKSVFNRTSETADFRGASDLIPPDDKSIAKEIRTTLLQRWASFDPSAAATFVIEADERVSHRQLTPVIQTWFDSDPKTAIEWTQSISSSEIRDIGLTALADLVIEKNPQQAWNLASSVTDELNRDALLKRIHRDWLKMDPTAAEAAKSTVTTTNR